MDWKTFALRLAIAVLVGLAVGIERHLRRKIAGLRVNTLVAAGTAIYCLVAEMSGDASSVGRVVGQVASGIGFLGAGVIIRDGLNIRGLDTAATLWCSAACGALAGTGNYWAAFVAAGGIVMINMVLHYFPNTSGSKQVEGAMATAWYEIRLTCAAEQVGQIRQTLLNIAWGIKAGEEMKNGEMKVESLVSMDTATPGVGEIILVCGGYERRDMVIERQVAVLAGEPGVKKVGWYFLGSMAPTPEKRSNDVITKVLFPPG